MELKTYYLEIDENDDSGVDTVALVDKPAIEVNWKAFNSHKPMQFAEDKERRILSGALMLADTPIYRRDEVYGEYNVVFTKETIEKIVNKFFKNAKQSSVNGMHNPDFTIKDVYMFESFLIDDSRGIKAPKGFEYLPQGSWFGSFKVENEEVWDEWVKTGKFRGFSVEGIFNQVPAGKQEYKEILSAIDELINILSK